MGFPFSLHHGNFAGLPALLAAEGVAAADLVLADLGMSSMQVDDPERGFSYRRDGPLDMRMDSSRGRTAAEVLAAIGAGDLRRALAELGDEPEAGTIAAAIDSGLAGGSVEDFTGNRDDPIYELAEATERVRAAAEAAHAGAVPFVRYGGPEGAAQRRQTRACSFPT